MKNLISSNLPDQPDKLEMKSCKICILNHHCAKQTHPEIWGKCKEPETEFQNLSEIDLPNFLTRVEFDEF